MRAAVIDEYGAPEVIQLRDMPVPDPGPGQVRINVQAAAVSATDVLTRLGYTIDVKDARFPMLLGWEAAGEVDALGEGVSHLQTGDPVAVFTGHMLTQLGTYAEQIVVPADGVVKRPDDLDPAATSTIGLSGLTALIALEAAEVSAGSSLLVIGALGAVGLLVTQLAAASGIEVFGSVGASQADEARRLGVAHVIDRDGDVAAQVRAVTPEGVDAAISTARPQATAGAIGAVRDSGKFVITVPDPNPPQERGIKPEIIHVRPNRPMLTTLVELLAKGSIDAKVARTFPLEQAAEAHEYFSSGSGSTNGRIVLVP